MGSKNKLQPNQEPLILADLEIAPKLFINNNISSIKQTDHSRVKELEKELMAYKKKCYEMEAKIDQQNNTIGNLKNMIKSTIKSEDNFMKTLVKKNDSLEEELNTY